MILLQFSLRLSSFAKSRSHGGAVHQGWIFGNDFNTYSDELTSHMTCKKQGLNESSLLGSL